MSTVHEHKVDRTGWKNGPWDTEPDRAEFAHAGFACMIIRNPVGAWCGYVGVPNTHPAYNQSYHDVDVRVHGGLTYGDTCQGHICHVPQPGMPDDVYWLGFDCNHAGDVAPGMFLDLPGYYGPEDEYRTMDYAIAETKRLAEQLAS